MDILQHTWGQVGLVILLQLMYIEISTVSCFAWHTPNAPSSQSVPAETHSVAQRWHQTLPKWYPYSMWKRRKRKELDEAGVVGNSVKRDVAFRGKMKDLVSKYQKLLDKLNRKKHMNSVFLNDKWRKEGKTTLYGTSYNLPNGVSSSAKSLTTKDYLSRKHKSHFGNIGSMKSSISNSAAEESLSEEKKKVHDSKEIKLSSNGFQKSSHGFGPKDGVKSPKMSDGFSDGFSSGNSFSGTFQKEADMSQSSGSWGDASWSDSGSWGDDGFGAGDMTPDSGSWGSMPEGSPGFSSAEGTFSEDNKDCETILSKSCDDNSQCSCYGFYTCTNQRCTPLQSSVTDSSSGGLGGQWGEGPIVSGFSKRKDPSKVIQIFMLPWKPEK